MAILPWTLLMTTMWPLRRRTIEGRRAVKGGKKKLVGGGTAADVKQCSSPKRSKKWPWQSSSHFWLFDAISYSDMASKKCRPHSSLTLSESNGPKVICFHNISLNWNVGIQYIATVADSSIVDEDIHLSITLQDLLCSSVHCVCVSQVKDNSAGSVSLVVEQNRTKELFYASQSLSDKTISVCLYSNWSMIIGA